MKKCCTQTKTFSLTCLVRWLSQVQHLLTVMTKPWLLLFLLKRRFLPLTHKHSPHVSQNFFSWWLCAQYADASKQECFTRRYIPCSSFERGTWIPFADRHPNAPYKGHASHDLILQSLVVSSVTMCVEWKCYNLSTLLSKGKGFEEDVRLISQASAADFMQANESQDVISMANSKKTCRRVQLALRQLLFSTSMVLLTDGYRQRCRHLGHALNLYFGALNGFSTHNFADGYHPLLYQLADHNSINLTRQAPLLPTLQTMHKLAVGCPAAAARLFLLLENLSYRHLFSVTAKIGSLSKLRRTCASIEEDDYASTAVPGVLGFTEAIFEPLESQGRGCIPHGHRKIYRTPNALTSLETLLQKAVSKDNESASQSMDKALDEEVKKLNSQLIATAASCQYESASLLGKDLGITVRDEPFSAKEQKQSKFDGLMETDGETQRVLIPVCEPDQFAHVAAEAQTAANERRNPRHSYKEIDLTTCQLSIFPHYRLPTRILDVPATTEDGCLNNDRMADYPSGFPWRVNEHGQFTGFYLQNGDATQFDLFTMRTRGRNRMREISGFCTATITLMLVQLVV